MHALTTASNTCRNRSLSRKRPWRLTEMSNGEEPCRREREAELVIGQVQFDLLTQLALGANAIALGNHEHADHKLRVDRSATNVAVEGRKLLAQARKHAGNRRVDQA
jgi:hypothetical protein